LAAAYCLRLDLRHSRRVIFFLLMKLNRFIAMHEIPALPMKLNRFIEK
jgi:hypothetical protein